MRPGRDLWLSLSLLLHLSKKRIMASFENPIGLTPDDEKDLSRINAKLQMSLGLENLAIEEGKFNEAELHSSSAKRLRCQRQSLLQKLISLFS
jgi:hypothetical protein